MEWTGFTDDQLRRLKSGSEQDSHISNYPSRKPTESHGQRNRPLTARPPPQRGRGPPVLNHSRESEPAPAHLKQNQMLSKPKQVQQQQQQRRTNQRPDRTDTPGPGSGSSNHEPNRTQTPVITPPNEISKEEKRTQLGKELNDSGRGTRTDGEDRTRKIEGAASDKCETSIGKELDEKEGLTRELTKLEEFQQQQKEIEEENQRKKNLLSMAIADRKKKTQAEVKRLAFIQMELSKIEVFLTTDVNILRDKIEEASRDYSEAQKRYKKAEVEYVNAKLHLHKASEHKEGLTGHLYTIIRENELRKSKKLEELVEKLDMTNLQLFEAEMEVEAAKKAETQRHLSSSSVGNASEDPNRTLSVSPTRDVPSMEQVQEPNLPTSMTSETEAKNSTSVVIQGPTSSTLPSNITPGMEVKDSPSGSIQGQRSLTSSTGDGAVMQKEVHVVPSSSTSHGTFGAQDKDAKSLVPCGQTLSNKDLSQESEYTQKQTVPVQGSEETISNDSKCIDSKKS